MALFETYHRLMNNSTQSTTDAQRQVQSGMVCGRGRRQAGGGISPIPSAKAFRGPLPPNEGGIEFTTNIKPSSQSPLLGGVCYWHAGIQGVIVDPSGDLACIPVTIAKVV